MTRRSETHQQVKATKATDGCVSCGADPERVQRGQALLIHDAAAFDVAETFRALADSTRVKIVYSLLHQELCTCDLAMIAGVSESVISQHLRVLRQLRLVKSRRSGKMMFHSLDDAHIQILLLVCLNHVGDTERRHADVDKMLALVSEAR